MTTKAITKKNGNASPTMTKSERQELGQLIRKREKVMKALAADRAAAMTADFEDKIARIYSYDDDETWKKATRLADAAVAEAKEKIAERCQQLGIPREFAPTVDWCWYSRGENAVAQRRTELRKVASTRIEAARLKAISTIERLSLEAQTEVIAHGMQSPEARAFLENLTPIDELMPMISDSQVRELVASSTVEDDD